MYHTASERPASSLAHDAIAVSTVPFDGHLMITALDVLAELGVAVVELAYIEGYGDVSEADLGTDNAARVARLLAERGQRCRALSAHIDLGFDDAIPRIARRCAFAAAIGVDIVITNTSTAGRRARFLENAREAAVIARSLGVHIALENPGHGRANLFGAAAEGCALLDLIGSDHIGLNYDVGNVLTYSEGRVRPETDIRHAAPQLIRVHLKDVRSTGQEWRFMPIGGGEIDFSAVLAGLASQGRANTPMSIELPLRLDRPVGGEPVRRAMPVSLDEIRTALKASLQAVREAELQVRQGECARNDHS